MADDAYLHGLTLLARRELSQAQLRQRLARRGCDQDAIDAAVARLLADRALDDVRVARAIARDAVALKHRGPRRVVQQIRAAGIAADTAAEVAREVFADAELEALLDAALLRKRRQISGPFDDRARARLYRYLIGQGHEPDRVAAALGRLGRAADDAAVDDD